MPNIFLVIVDKGGEISHKDKIRGEDISLERDLLKFEHTNRGSKLIDYLLHLFEH